MLSRTWDTLQLVSVNAPSHITMVTSRVYQAAEHRCVQKGHSQVAGG